MTHFVLLFKEWLILVKCWCIWCMVVYDSMYWMSFQKVSLLIKQFGTMISYKAISIVKQIAFIKQLITSFCTTIGITWPIISDSESRCYTTHKNNYYLACDCWLRTRDLIIIILSTVLCSDLIITIIRSPAIVLFLITISFHRKSHW